MKKVIISGSSSGIGRAISEKLLDDGYVVIGLARDHDKFNPKNSSYFPYVIDFSDIYAAERILRDIYQCHADTEVIIGNAGYGRFGCLEQFSVKQISDLLNVNFLGQVLLVKTFLPELKRCTQGRIILMGSEAALAGAKQGSIYCATKFALRGFAQSLRKECAGAGVTVTLVNPGLVQTPFFDELKFCPGPDAENVIQAADVAHIISDLLRLKNHLVVEEINLQPLRRKVQKKALLSKSEQGTVVF